MTVDERIISVKDTLKRATIDDFRLLMKRAEDKLNNESVASPHLYYKIGATKLEKESCECLQSVCDGIIFKSEDIQLVSGRSFPDILAKPRFGVEIKSTISDQWTSVGSSIVESSRLDEVDDIYMLFGKLGSNPPEFKCRPYGEVLKEIHVTHSPRYTIDMQLHEGETIFDKMNTTYNSFRRDENKINIVRKYYRAEATKTNSGAVPWWLDTETSVNMEIMRKGMNPALKQRLIAEMLILFDSIILGDYEEAAVWLCTRRNTINPSFRDPFSAGGRCICIDDLKVAKPYPHIVGTIIEHRHIIEKILSNQSSEILPDIVSTWSEVNLHTSLYEQWVRRTIVAFKKKKELSSIPIETLLSQKPKTVIYTTSKG